VVAALAQATVLPYLEVLGVKVDLVILLVLAWSMRRGVEAGLIWALIGGIALDVLTAGPFGLGLVSCAVVTLIGGAFGPMLRRTSAFLPLVLTPLASILATLASALAMAALGWPIIWPELVALVVLPSALLNSLAMLVVYPLVAAIDARAVVSDWPA
jgi:rod shape-determining protein MreD